MVFVIKTKQYFNGKINPINNFRVNQYNEGVMDEIPQETVEDIQAASDEGLMSGEGFRRRRKRGTNNNNLRKFISLNIK
jgi:hypothetical protein